MAEIDQHALGEDDVVDYGGAERITGLPRGTLYALVHLRGIPHFRLGRRLVRFSRTTLQAWLAKRAVAVTEK